MIKFPEWRAANHQLQLRWVRLADSHHLEWNGGSGSDPRDLGSLFNVTGQGKLRTASTRDVGGATLLVVGRT